MVVINKEKIFYQHIISEFVCLSLPSRAVNNIKYITSELRHEIWKEKENCGPHKIEQNPNGGNGTGLMIEQKNRKQKNILWIVCEYSSTFSLDQKTLDLDLNCLSH